MDSIIAENCEIFRQSMTCSECNNVTDLTGNPTGSIWVWFKWTNL